MSNFKIFALALFLLFNVFSNYAQQEAFTISEGGQSTICGRIVIVDAIWMQEGYIHCDISILKKQYSKPVTGGYKTGDEITITSEPGCTYYINSITKTGDVKSKGSVTLSKTPPENGIEIFKDKLIQEENNTYRIGDYSWFVSAIRNENGGPTAYISITRNTAETDNLILVSGSVVWMGDRLYKVETITARSEFIKTDPERIYEPLPGKIEYKALSESLNER